MKCLHFVNDVEPACHTYLPIEQKHQQLFPIYASAILLNLSWTHLYPLFPVDLHAVGAQRGDGSVDDLLHHLRVSVGLLQLGGGDPDVAVGGDVLAGFVEDTAGVLVRLQASQRQPQLGGGRGGKG